MEKTIFLGGAHRGGQAITETALKEPKAFDAVIIADPKEKRALQLAQEWENSGIKAKGLKEPCERAIDKIEADSIILAIDIVKPMAEILKKRSSPTQWQLLARGTGIDGPVIGLAGTVTDGDGACRMSSIKLINELSSFIEPQTSEKIRENPLNGDRLHMMRKTVSRHSVRRLGLLEREPTDMKGGTLNFFWGEKAYPLMIQEKQVSERWRETKQRAIDTGLPAKLQNSSEFAVATVGQKNIDFFLIEAVRGRRMIRFHMPLVHVLPENLQGLRMPFGSFGAIAASSLGVLALASKIAAAAVVTD